jgi:acetyl esterase/lipase
VALRDPGRVAVHGFSNGAAFAAALVCSGESLDQRLIGVVIDDPVTDAATVDCRPAEGVAIALYWTGALAEQAPIGTECSSIDWTCSGPVVRGIEATADDLDVEVMASPYTDHVMYVEAAEPREWLAAGS